MVGVMDAERFAKRMWMSYRNGDFFGGWLACQMSWDTTELNSHGEVVNFFAVAFNVRSSSLQ